MPALAFVNQKGGVLKTTATVNVAERLARRGHRVLVIDVDKQGAATSTLMAEEPLEHDNTIADILRNELPLDSGIVPADQQWGGVELVPASLDLEDVWASNKPSLVFRLRRAMDEAELATRYDWVLMDGPPDLGPGSVSAIIASDHVVVPFKPERMSMQGVARTIDTVNVVKRDMRSDVQLTALVAAAVSENLGEHASRIDEARRLYGDRVADTMIPHRLKSDEASGFGIPAAALQGPAGTALAAVYDQLVDELIQRTKDK